MLSSAMFVHVISGASLGSTDTSAQTSSNCLHTLSLLPSNTTSATVGSAVQVVWLCTNAWCQWRVQKVLRLPATEGNCACCYQHCPNCQCCFLSKSWFQCHSSRQRGKRPVLAHQRSFSEVSLVLQVVLAHSGFKTACVQN